MNTVTRLLVGGLLLTFAASFTRAADAPRKPNIIFILSDDVAQGDLGCYGQKLIKTPNIDRMAREGMRTTQAYCGTTVCAEPNVADDRDAHRPHSHPSQPRDRR